MKNTKTKIYIYVGILLFVSVVLVLWWELPLQQSVKQVNNNVQNQNGEEVSKTLQKIQTLDNAEKELDDEIKKLENLNI